MRAVIQAMVGAVFMVQPALASSPCKSEADRVMFDVEALKSQLIVLATACHQSTEYNAFVGRYQADLATYDHALDGYFRREFGRSAEKEHDLYITNLANAHSDAGLAQGTDFCPRNDVLFHEVMSLDGASELPLYAAGKNLVPPTLAACMAPEAPSRAVRPTRPAPPRHGKA